jgi:hypothetical protein
MHPADRLLEWLPECDFGVLHHAFADHGRDYLMVVQIGGVRAPGTYEVRFTHCVALTGETRVRDEVWPASWSEEFTDYHCWEAAGEPNAYVWGTKWSLAYPGLTVVRDSATATSWSRRLGQDMHEITVETDRFWISLVFHDIAWRKLDDRTDPVSRVVIPLGP